MYCSGLAVEEQLQGTDIEIDESLFQDIDDLDLEDQT